MKKNIENNIDDLNLDVFKKTLCEVHIHKDRMKVSLWLNHDDDEAVSLQEIKEILATQNVVFGVVSDEILNALIQKGHVNNAVIAEGIEPIDGNNSMIISMLPEINRGSPIIDGEDIVDYRELGDILMVRKGDVLITRIEATESSPGVDVFGENILAQEGKNRPILLHPQSTRLAPDNPNQLIATITGQPVITEDSAFVSPILELESVDLSTGNIRFNGSIIINKNIEQGMKVYSSRDIVVNGCINDAKVECLGDLFVANGVFGSSELLVNGNVRIKKGIQGKRHLLNQVPETSSARIVASGFVFLDFAENFVIESEGSIVAEQYVMNCNLMADNISIGTKDLNAAIIGGNVWATHLIKAPIIGNNAGLVTKIRVGVNPQIQTAIDEISILLEMNEKKQESVRKTMAHILVNNTHEYQNKINQLSFILHELESEANAYQMELDALKLERKYVENPKVIIARKINFGSVIQIRKSFWRARKEMSGKNIFALNKLNEIEILKHGSSWFK
jgi:uncharacterized protein (DUF342 family)